MADCKTNKTVHYYIYANDYSASTSHCSYYHTNGLNTLEQFKKDVAKISKTADKICPTESKIIYLNWGHRCDEVNEEIIRLTHLKKEGKGDATKPDTIVKWLQDNCDVFGEYCKIKLLYIITDGLIDHHSARDCFKINENMHYETVVFHAFNNNANRVDLSVASSFFKSFCVVYCNNQLYDSTNISEQFDYAKINLDNFPSEVEQLKSYIKLKYINKFKQNTRALEEIENLKKLRARLFDELENGTEKCNINLETKDRNVFISEFKRTDWYRNLKTTVQASKVDIDKAITTMINYLVSENKSYSFDVLKFNIQFKKAVEEEPIVDVNFTAEQEIAFPDIILEDEKGVPVIILAKLDLLDKIIFHGKDPNSVVPASFSKFKTTMECPLFLVNDKDISESIGYFYTFNTYKQFLENNINTEPRTRKPFYGGIVLLDTNEFDKYNDYILSATYFNSKKVNFNIGLFYYVLWKNCENKEWMDRNVVEQFKKYAMRRISETVCKIGLSSLPLDPQINTSLLTALWYCVEISSIIFKDDPQLYTHERLRMYFGVTQSMIEILKYFEYDLDLKSVERRRDLISHVMTLKKIPTRREKVYYLLKKIFRTVDGFLVSEIERPFNIYKLNYLKLNHREILKDDVIDETVHLNDYVHLMHVAGNDIGAIDICNKTYRPYFAIDENKSFYTELVANTKKVVINNDSDGEKIKITFEPLNSLQFDRIISLFNLFINCVKDMDKYPTLSEYTDYVIQKKMYSDDLVTIFPSNIYIGIKEVYRSYQGIVKNVEVKEFIRVCKSNVKRIERVKAEERIKFSTDEEITEFICKEETKVNLLKRIT